jgi:hypothetical protein
MALDPRIALMGTQWQAPDFQGAMRQGQEYRKNQMAERRAAQVEQVLQNYFASQAAPPAAPPAAAPPVAAPAMQPGSSGPPITGAPLPSVNAMGASMGAPTPAATPARASRNIDPLLMIADDPRAAAIIAQNARDAAAAAAAVDNTRQQGTADIQRGTYTQGLLQQGAVNLLDDQSDEAIVRNAAMLAAMPGADVPMINASRDALLAMPPPQRATTVRRTAAIDTGASRAAGLTEPNLVPRTDGASSWFEDMNRNSQTFGQRFSVTEMQETPATRAAGTRAADTDTRQDTRDLQRRWDAYDADVATHNRWVESAEGPQQRAQRAQAERPRPPAEPRPGSSAPAAAPRRKVYNQATGVAE